MVTEDIKQQKKRELGKVAIYLGRPLTGREVEFMDWMRVFCDLETIEIFSKMIVDAALGVKE